MGKARASTFTRKDVAQQACRKAMKRMKAKKPTKAESPKKGSSLTDFLEAQAKKTVKYNAVAKHYMEVTEDIAKNLHVLKKHESIKKAVEEAAAKKAEEDRLAAKAAEEAAAKKAEGVRLAAEAAKKAEEEQVKAQGDLQLAATGNNIEVLAQSLTRAAEAGVAENALSEARGCLETLRREDASNALQDAIQGESIERLDSAIGALEELGGQSSEIESARKRRVQLEAQGDLKVAATGNNIEVLAQSLTRAAEAGVAENALSEARGCLETLRREAKSSLLRAKAAAELQKACEVLIKTLESSIHEARVAGVDDSTLERAQEALQQTRDRLREQRATPIEKLRNAVLAVVTGTKRKAEEVFKEVSTLPKDLLKERLNLNGAEGDVVDYVESSLVAFRNSFQ